MTGDFLLAVMKIIIMPRNNTSFYLSTAVKSVIVGATPTPSVARQLRQPQLH